MRKKTRTVDSGLSLVRIEEKAEVIPEGMEEQYALWNSPAFNLGKLLDNYDKNTWLTAKRELIIINNTCDLNERRRRIFDAAEGAFNAIR
jgi:hypothetical protein